MVKQSSEVSKFYDTRYGELNIAINSDGLPMFCLTDVCRGLELLKREGDRLMKQSDCLKQEYFVKRIKQVVGMQFIDENGFLTLVTESRKTKADKYRIWAMGLAKGIQTRIKRKQRVAAMERDQNGKFKKNVLDLTKDLEGPYPTLDEYLKDYVPVEYLIPLISDTLKDYLSSVTPRNEEHKKQIEHRVSVLNTLNLTLIGNMKTYQGRSYANNNKTQVPSLCK